MIFYHQKSVKQALKDVLAQIIPCCFMLENYTLRLVSKEDARLAV